jgi:hypothetical protein
MTSTGDVILDQLQCDKTIKTALIKYNFKEIEPEQLGELIDMTVYEIQLLKIFWQPVFNKNWVYLNRNMINQWFCKNDTSKYAVKNFYNRSLLKPGKYDIGIDYMEIKNTDPLIELSENYRWSKPTTNKGGQNARHYAVTGECFKMICMERNKSIRKYYIKIEILAIMMRDYILALTQYINAKTITSLNNTIQNQKVINTRIQTYINNTKTVDKNTTLYIATSKKYAQENIFKVGCVDSIETSKLRSRLCSYNTGRIGDDLFYFSHIIQVCVAKDLDYKLKKILAPFKNNKQKEMVVLHYEMLLKFVGYIANNHEKEYDFFNHYVENYHSYYINKNPVIPDAVDISDKTEDKTEITITETKNNVEINRQVIDVSNLSKDDREEKIKEAINKYLNDSGEHTDFDCDKHTITEGLSISWSVIKQTLMTILNIQQSKKLKSTLWWTDAKEIAADSNIKLNYR